MKALKQFFALLIILAVLTVSVIVAFRLAPETWAMIAGVIFGVVAALPMCAVVIMMLRQRPAPPPPQQVMPAPQPPQIILLQPGAPMPYPYAGQAPPPQHMLPQPNPAYYPAPPPPARYAARPEWEDLDAEEETEYRAPPAPKATYRILGQ